MKKLDFLKQTYTQREQSLWDISHEKPVLLVFLRHFGCVFCKEAMVDLSNVRLDWEDTPGANQYLVIYDRFMSFTFNPQKTIVSESELTIADNLTEDVTYYWKVWPYNESQTGAGYSATQNFRTSTGTAVNNITEINEYTLSPNPVRDLGNATLTLSSTKPFAATLEVTSATGQRLSKQSINVTSGVSQHQISTTDLSAGLYFVVLHSDNGRLVERLLIIE